MIAKSTLKILRFEQADWEALTLKEQIKTIHKTLKVVHPDHNKNDDTECKELLEYLRYLRNEDNCYERMYLPVQQNEPQSSEGSVSASSHASAPVVTSHAFFAEFKQTIAKKYANNWTQAFKDTFVVKNPHHNPKEKGEFAGFSSPYDFHILRLVTLYPDSATRFNFEQISAVLQATKLPGEHSDTAVTSALTEADFDKALAFIYYLIRFERPYQATSARYVLPLAFIEDKELSLKILAQIPDIISTARDNQFPDFWQSPDFWRRAIQTNARIFDIFFFKTSSWNDPYFLKPILQQEFNDRSYMSALIARNPIAIFWLGDALTADLDLLGKAIESLSYSPSIVTKLIQSLPPAMRTMDSPLAKKVLNDIDISFLAAFTNTDNTNLYFEYLHRACCTLDARKLVRNDSYFPKSERSVFINTLPEEQQAYAQDFCELFDNLMLYQKEITATMQARSVFFFPKKMQDYARAAEELRKFMQGTGDLATLNTVLPHLQTSLLGPKIVKWLAHTQTNPALRQVVYVGPNQSRLAQFATFVQQRETQATGLLALGYVAACMSLAPSITAILILTMIAAICALILQKTMSYDNDEGNFVRNWKR
jgi:hypothetical protein